jgi:hypothetical protein
MVERADSIVAVGGIEMTGFFSSFISSKVILQASALIVFDIGI